MVRPSTGRRALRSIAMSFFALAVYVAADSARALVGDGDAEHSSVGLVLAPVAGHHAVPVRCAAPHRPRVGVCTLTERGRPSLSDRRITADVDTPPDDAPTLQPRWHHCPKNRSEPPRQLRHTEAMVEMRPGEAREFWKALMDNATSLIADARCLLSAGSFGRARSLTVLAQEELGKALWVYDAFQSAWSQGDEKPRTVDQLAQYGLSHTRKYLEAVVFGDELAEFWGDYSAMSDLGNDQEAWEAIGRRRHEEAKVTATEANRAKQRGFYVDRGSDGTVLSPTEIPAGTTAEDLQTAARVIEMLLIRDHSRMKFGAVTPYDSTYPQQFRLLPVSHPEEWAAATGKPTSAVEEEDHGTAR